jgi:hypothetical protein
VAVAPLQAAKPWQAKLARQPMTELHRQRKRAPARPLVVRLPELRLPGSKKPLVALVVADSGTETQFEPGWVLAAVLTTNLRGAEPEQVAW